MRGQAKSEPQVVDIKEHMCDAGVASYLKCPDSPRCRFHGTRQFTFNRDSVNLRAHHSLCGICTMYKLRKVFEISFTHDPTKLEGQILAVRQKTAKDSLISIDEAFLNTSSMEEYSGMRHLRNRRTSQITRLHPGGVGQRRFVAWKLD
jgi:hypothetical protein